MPAIHAPRLRRAAHDCVRLTTYFLVLFLFTLRAFAGQVSLAWDASADSRVTGYNVHYGTQSGSYTTTQSVGSTTSTTVSGLTAGQIYYFVVRARDSAGTESANSNQVSATIPVAAPTASISATPTSGNATLAVAFTGTVTGATSYTWNFGDSVTDSSSLQPSHKYTTPGTYTARLTASGAGGTVTSNTQTITVTASSGSSSSGSGATTSQAPVGAIVSPSTDTSVATNTRVQFVGSGTGSNQPLTYSWDFGNGSTSTSQNPRKRFSSPGSYCVKLTVRDSKGVADSSPPTVRINVGSSGTTYGCTGATTSSSTGTTSSGSTTTTSSGSTTTTSSGSTTTTSVTMGETLVLPHNDSGNGNLLVAQGAVLSSTATLKSLSFYVTAASGSLRLGVYDATGPGGGPGALKAQTNAFTPVVGWNTANVISSVALPAGNYWLAYFPSSSSLNFATDYFAGDYRYANLAFGPMPSTFPTINGQGVTHWSLYGTLTR